MLKGLQTLTLWQRRIVVISILIGGLLALIGVTLLLVNLTLNTHSRQQGQGLLPSYTVRQFATLPDDDAYPAAVTAGADGTVYTGSYATGAIWAITPDGASVRELPGTRDALGSVSALAVAADGALLVVDQIDTDPRSVGGAVMRVAADGAISTFAMLPSDQGSGFVAPNDMALDGDGRVYVTDPGRNEVWRFDADGTNAQVWWVPPASTEDETRTSITGIGYDATRQAMLITDPELNRIYQAPLDGGETQLIYNHGQRANPPGFDGITVSPAGTIYVAALGQNGVAIVNDGDLDYIAGLFRGSSDVEFAPPNRLYVANFDQASIVIPLLQPQLPFAIDAIEIAAEGE